MAEKRRQKEEGTREPADVLLGADWIERWLSDLDPHELRERTFRRYPALRDEYELAREHRDPDMPPWRMWMELSLYLMSRFEERYGSLKAEHGEVFKEVSAQLLRLKLEIVDRLTKDI